LAHHCLALNMGCGYVWFRTIHWCAHIKRHARQASAIEGIMYSVPFPVFIWQFSMIIISL
jgi:hypothetical protein